MMKLSMKRECLFWSVVVVMIECIQSIESQSIIPSYSNPLREETQKNGESTWEKNKDFLFRYLISPEEEHERSTQNSKFRIESDGDLSFSRPSKKLGSEFLGKRTVFPVTEDDEKTLYIEKRKIGSEFLGKKRRLGSEFLGKRNENFNKIYKPDEDLVPTSLALQTFTNSDSGKPELENLTENGKYEIDSEILEDHNEELNPIESRNNLYQTNQLIPFTSWDNNFHQSHILQKRRMGSEFLGKRIGSEFLGKRMGSEFLGKRPMGSEFLGKRRMGSEFLGKRRMGSEFLGKRRMGSEFLGKRRMGSEFLGKRRMGSEFLGKRRMGSEFLGKRRMGSEFLGKRRMGSEFLGKRTISPMTTTGQLNIKT